MTSARWMSKIKPHPIWKFLQKKFRVKEDLAPYILVGNK